MIRIIHNSLKHLYYGSLLNLYVAKIDRYFRSREIEKTIKERGDTILSNRSFIGHSTYATRNKSRIGNPPSCQIHGGKYKYFPLYTTKQQIEDIASLSHSSPQDELEALLKVFIDAEAKVKAKNENNNI